jgi:NADPH-dependent glutamate synthase beta subunit-like oxidoreductase
VRVGAKRPEPAPTRKRPAGAPDSVVIVGAGPAGLTAALTLRREGYDGAVTWLGAEATPPVDRPNLSKD